jgi:hypothetical protein
MTPLEIQETDRKWKARASTSFDADSVELWDLWRQQTRLPVYRFLEVLKLGDKSNRRPPAPSILGRLVDQLAVLYRTPPVRQLTRAGVALPDEDPAVVALADVYRRSRVQAALARAEQVRTLLGQAVIVWCEQQKQKRIVARVHPPHSVWRAPSDEAADTIEADEAIVIVRDHASSAAPKSGCYEVWRREEAGAEDQWRVSLECADGSTDAHDQPYPETEGVFPADLLPIQVWYDAEPVGEAWAPPAQSRLDAVQNASAMLCDLTYLVALEASTWKVAYGVNVHELPTDAGPNKITAFANTNARMELLSHSPKISESTDAIKVLLSMLALSEGLAPNAFAVDRTELTGAALQAADRLIDARRLRQIDPAIELEAGAYRRIAALHATYADGWGQMPLATDCELAVSFGVPSIPVDAKAEQDVAFRDMQAGLLSPIDYMQSRRGLADRGRAIAELARVRSDRTLVGWTPDGQPTGALVDGPRSAAGPGSATIDRAATNLDPQSRTEGASVVDAVTSALP